MFLWQVCYDCYEKRLKTDPDFALIGKTKAKEIYLLVTSSLHYMNRWPAVHLSWSGCFLILYVSQNEKDFSKVCKFTIGDPGKPLESATFCSRLQVESVAFGKYENGRDGLLADKASRAAKAEKRYAERLAAYHVKLEQAKRELNSKRPKRPTLSKLATPLESDGGLMCTIWKDSVLLKVGFPTKETGLPPPDVQRSGSTIYCHYCMEASALRTKKVPSSFFPLYLIGYTICIYHSSSSIFRRKFRVVKT